MGIHLFGQMLYLRRVPSVPHLRAFPGIEDVCCFAEAVKLEQGGGHPCCMTLSFDIKDVH